MVAVSLPARAHNFCGIILLNELIKWLELFRKLSLPTCPSVCAETCRNTAGPRLMEWVKVDAWHRLRCLLQVSVFARSSTKRERAQCRRVRLPSLVNPTIRGLFLLYATRSHTPLLWGTTQTGYLQGPVGVHAFACVYMRMHKILRKTNLEKTDLYN